MKVFGPEVTAELIERAADGIGVRAANLRPDGSGFRFVLRTVDSGLRDGPAYRRVNQHNGRTVPGAVCWHGHRAFMRELYRHAPEAKIRTALANYDGAEHFERTHSQTAHHAMDYYGVRTYGADCAC